MSRGPSERGLRCCIGGPRPGASSTCGCRGCSRSSSLLRSRLGGAPRRSSWPTSTRSRRHSRRPAWSGTESGLRTRRAARRQPFSSRGCDSRARDSRERTGRIRNSLQGDRPALELAEVHARTGDEEAAEASLAPTSLLASLRAPSPGRPRRGREACSHPTTSSKKRSRDLRPPRTVRRRWSLARTQLAFGERLRRAGRRLDAREQLRSALETFEDQGAEAWVERVRAELRASGRRSAAASRGKRKS